MHERKGGNAAPTPMTFCARILMLCGALAVLCGAGCHPGQEIAPGCFSTSVAGHCIEPASGLRLSVDCSKLPSAVATANYEFIVPHVPLPAGHSSNWEAQGLPPGLTMGSGGVIRGRPTQAGQFSDIFITLRDLDTQREFIAQCSPLEVFPALKVDLSKTQMGCITRSDDLKTLISGGTGEALHCSVPAPPNPGAGCPHGFGNGVKPKGIVINKDCSFSGSIDLSVPQSGTFVWIVEVQQNGAQRFVPFCATLKRDTAHRIELLEKGQPLDYTRPYRAEYEPDSAIVVGTETDPRIQVTAACADNSCNRRGISVTGSCSPLDFSVTQMLSKVQEVRKGASQIVGLTHGFPLHSGGQKLSDLGLGQRPWVMSLNTRYCTSPQVEEIRACEVPGALESNITWSVIAWPKTP